MKARALLISALTIGLASTPAIGEPDYGLIGAAAGAAAGLIIGNNVDGVNKAVAVPVLAVAGGIVGHRMQKEQRRHRVSDGYRVPVRAAPAAPAAASTDPQPGVDLIKVSILNSNGIRTDVPILRTGGRFVGPQGESYPSLPTGEELQRRYGL
jgi:hypothetical protein